MTNNQQESPQTSSGDPGYRVPHYFFLEANGEQFSVQVRPTTNWKEVSFSISYEGATLHARRTLDGQIRLCRWETRNPSASEPLASYDGWVEVTDAPNPESRAATLLAYVKGLSDEDVLAEVKRLNANSLAYDSDNLRSYEVLAENQQAVVNRGVRRCAALAISEPELRGGAVRLAEEWAGATAQMLQVASEIASPTVLLPDAPPPAL